MHDHATVLGPLAAVWLIGVFTPSRRGAVMRLYTRFQKWLLRAVGTVFVGFGLKLAIDR
jgi:threonine/homoserine/homoserine lactone efflux protein